MTLDKKMIVYIPYKKVMINQKVGPILTLHVN